MSESTFELRSNIKKHIQLRLASGMVDVELDPEHLDLAIDTAILKYRQRAQNSVEESYAFLELKPDQQTYVLPKEIMSVRQIFRRGIGSVLGTTAIQFEPFAASYMNTYMLQSGRVGGMLTYELFSGYQEMAARMFGGYINFTFNPSTKVLTLVRHVREGSEGEQVLLWTHNHKPEIQLLTDFSIMPWIQDYSYAMAKFMLGEAREKFGSIAGPQGGTSLNGAQLKSEAQAEMDKLIEDLKNYVDGSQPLSFIIG